MSNQEQGMVPTIRNIESCCWYPHVKGITADKKVDEEAVFLFSVHRFLKKKWKEVESDLAQYLSDLMQLMLFINKHCFGYKANDNMNLCIEVIAQGRFMLMPREREGIDKQMKECVNHISEYGTVYNIIVSYFTTMEDIDFIVDYLHKHAEHMLDDLLEEWKESNMSDKQLIEICNRFPDSKTACGWLSAYYVRIKQIKKAIQVLENYCNTKSKKDLSEEQMVLVRLYGKNHDKKKRDSLFQALLKNYYVEKTDLFCALKEGMSPNEWNTEGKDIVMHWAKKQDEYTCYQVYKAIDAGDLFLAHLVENGFTLYTLSDYADLLVETDLGVYFSLLKITIVRELENPYSYTELSEYEDFIPEKLLHSDAMKYIVLELQDEYKKIPTILKKLDLLEEKLYES